MTWRPYKTIYYVENAGQPNKKLIEVAVEYR